MVIGIARPWLALGSMIGGVLLVCAGCGGAGYKVAPVSGRVILDNEPLVGASVSFVPLDGSKENNVGAGSYGKTDAEGRYTLKLIENDQAGAAVGRHQVSISLAQQSDPSSESSVVVDKVPDRYRGSETSLSFEVPAGGTNEADFQLQTNVGT